MSLFQNMKRSGAKETAETQAAVSAPAKSKLDSIDADKELKKLRRVDLLELLLDATRENERLESDLISATALVDRLKAKLDEKDAQIERLKSRLDAKDLQIARLQARARTMQQGGAFSMDDLVEAERRAVEGYLNKLSVAPHEEGDFEPYAEADEVAAEVAWDEAEEEFEAEAEFEAEEEFEEEAEFEAETEDEAEAEFEDEVEAEFEAEAEAEAEFEEADFEAAEAIDEEPDEASAEAVEDVADDEPEWPLDEDFELDAQADVAEDEEIIKRASHAAPGVPLAKSISLPEIDNGADQPKHAMHVR